MVTKRLYLTSLILIITVLLGGILPALADETSSGLDDSVSEDWAGPGPLYDPSWPSPSPFPCDGINYLDDKHDIVLNLLPNILRGFGPWVPSRDMVVTRIELIHREYTLNFSYGIWSDDGGNPGKPLAPLAYTEYFQTTPEAAWYGANLINPLLVSAGTKYWIVLDGVDGHYTGVVIDPTPPYVATTNYLSTTGDRTGGANWEPDALLKFGYKVRIYCEPPVVGGNLQPLDTSFEIVRWATIPVIALIAATVYAAYHRKTGIIR